MPIQRLMTDEALPQELGRRIARQRLEAEKQKNSCETDKIARQPD